MINVPDAERAQLHVREALSKLLTIPANTVSDMSPEKKKKLGNDFILLGVLILIGAALWMTVVFFSKAGSYVVVTIDKEIVDRVPLNVDGEYSYKTDKGINVLVIKDGKADITEADCPDKICVNSPKILRTGETITCLPHRLVVTVEGDDPLE